MQVSAALDCDEHVIANRETIPGAMKLWARSTATPCVPPANTRKHPERTDP